MKFPIQALLATTLSNLSTDRTASCIKCLGITTADYTSLIPFQAVSESSLTVANLPSTVVDPSERYYPACYNECFAPDQVGCSNDADCPGSQVCKMIKNNQGIYAGECVEKEVEKKMDRKMKKMIKKLKKEMKQKKKRLQKNFNRESSKHSKSLME